MIKVLITFSSIGFFSNQSICFELFRMHMKWKKKMRIYGGERYDLVRLFEWSTYSHIEYFISSLFLFWTYSHIEYCGSYTSNFEYLLQVHKWFLILIVFPILYGRKGVIFKVMDKEWTNLHRLNGEYKRCRIIFRFCLHLLWRNLKKTMMIMILMILCLTTWID